MWLDLLIDKNKISSIFKNDVPSLCQVDLHDIVFHRDGPKITLRFNFQHYPSDPPKKWLMQGFNTVQVQLTALDVKEVRLSGWEKTNYLLDINIEKENGLIILSAQDDIFCLYVKAVFLDISSISAYIVAK
ncbi:Imm50 family immunity protein [Brenneria sp. g21c3]|uniref:Imm50 family immunity protein n=1 Tax=Brenneria sp. g21c3 TaxID=3093893 RepID=UPI002E9A643A|nr:Imm50 family immunity protein [Brenneria sp. g21c3]